MRDSERGFRPKWTEASFALSLGLLGLPRLKLRAILRVLVELAQMRKQDTSHALNGEVGDDGLRAGLEAELTDAVGLGGGFARHEVSSVRRVVVGGTGGS